MEAITTRSINERILAVLPLFYVGWADSVLSPSEMKFIRSIVANMTLLTKSDKEYLNHWTDPSQPPPEEVFKSWLNAIKAKASDLDHQQKSALVELGMRISSAGTSGEQLSKETYDSLVELEHALAIDNPVSAKLLLDQIDPLAGSESIDISFDVDELSKLLDGRYAQTKNRLRQLLRDPLFQLKHEPDKDIYRLRVLEQVKELARQGVSAYSFPKKYGGGERQGDHMIVFEMLAFSDLSMTVKFGVQFGLFGGALYLLGTERHHRKYLEPMHKAELLGCFAMTETGHGSNVKGLETTATYDHDTKEIIIHSPGFQAGKEYIGNALHSTLAVVFAQLIVNEENHGVHAVIVPVRDQKGVTLPGIKIEDGGYKLGLNGVDNGRIWFDQVRVPASNLLDRYGKIGESGSYHSPIENPAKRFFTMLGALVVGRISVGLAAVSTSKKALTIAIKYALQRRQFEAKPEHPEFLIMDYPSHMERLIPALAHTYAYDFALHDLADRQVADDGTDHRKIETLAAGLKSKATWHATHTIQESREACGGKGYLTENQLSALKADSDIFTTFEGDNTVLMQLVAKGVLTEFKQSFHEEGNRALIRYLLKKANHKLSEFNFIQKRNSDYGHLVSTEFIEEAFEFRFEKTLIKLSERMRKYLKRKVDPHDVFLKTQMHLMELADSYIDKITLESFRNKIGDAPDHLKPILNRMFQLFGLHTIYLHHGWYLENDFIEGIKSKAIRKIRTKLIQDLRPDIEGLVNAFGIPDECLAAPIAFKEYT